MNSATLTPTVLPYFSHFLKPFLYTNLSPRYHIQFRPNKETKTELLSKSLKCNHNLSILRSTRIDTCLVEVKEEKVAAAAKLQRLVLEFKSLKEPIDRVKRLLHYASCLPPMDESAQIPANRVNGCTVEVWLEVRMDGSGRMRFGADSDSEITKGLCWCLISVFDGAQPDEVVEVEAEDLTAVNVGLGGGGGGGGGRARSRVNTWQNVFISMQKRTKALVEERQRKLLIDPFIKGIESTTSQQSLTDLNGAVTELLVSNKV